MIDRVIVSRHAAAIEFIARYLSGDVYDQQGTTELGHRVRVGDNIIPVLASATAEQVRGKIVFGNIPLHLAASAAHVGAIEFPAAPPRGQEYSLADMDAAGASIRWYQVRGGQDQPHETRRTAQGCGLYKIGEPIYGGTVVDVVPPSDCDGGEILVALDVGRRS